MKKFIPLCFLLLSCSSSPLLDCVDGNVKSLSENKMKLTDGREYFYNPDLRKKAESSRDKRSSIFFLAGLEREGKGWYVQEVFDTPYQCSVLLSEVYEKHNEARSKPRVSKAI